MMRFMLFAAAFVVCFTFAGETRADHCSGGVCGLGQPVRSTAKAGGKAARRAGTVAKAAVVAPVKAVARVVKAKPARKALGALFCR